jgi:hypothetical protein
MTPKGRTNFYYYTGVALCVVGGVIVAIGWERSNVLVAVGATCIAAFVALAVIGMATSRCPTCRRYIDLRGGSAYCPRCGHWIPAREGEPIRSAHPKRN